MTGILDQIIRSMQGGATPSRNLPSDLGPLLDQLRQAGLGRQVDSWIGTGPNEPVDPQELERALGRRQAGPQEGGILGGLGGGLLGGLVAQALPYIINAMTPRGRVADEDVPEGGLGRVLESIRPGRQGGALPDTGGDDLSGMLGRTLGNRQG